MEDLRQLDSRKAFGRAINRWFSSNGWPQKICEQWCEPDGRNVKGPWASQISQVIHNRLDPRTEFFKALAIFNKAVCERDLPRLRDTPLVYNRLINSEPFLMEDGQPATATDFFSMYVGDLAIPKDYRAVNFTEADLNDLLTACNKAIDRVCLETYISRSDIMQIVDERCLCKLGNVGVTIKEALLGVSVPTVEELIEYVRKGEMDPADGCPVSLVIEDLLKEASKPLEWIEAHRAFTKEKLMLLR